MALQRNRIPPWVRCLVHIRKYCLEMGFKWRIRMPPHLACRRECRPAPFPGTAPISPYGRSRSRALSGEKAGYAGNQESEGEFSGFGLASFLYACLYAFCMYRNSSGVTYPFFVAGSLLFICFCFAKLEISLKKEAPFIRSA